MSAIMVKLECITNLHVGNGDVNYNIIDNEVERDPVWGYPTINSSGVKGALREYFSKYSPKDVSSLFGSDKSKETTQGKLKFLSADLLALAVRASTGNKAYYLVTSENAFENYVRKHHLFLNEITIEKQLENNEVAAEGVKLNQYIKVLNHKVYLVKNDVFSSFTSSLPVLARNHLENGISKNLWYEEVVPHESIFTFYVLGVKQDLDVFKSVVHGKIIQFGGNATIGYGLCHVHVIEE